MKELKNFAQWSRLAAFTQMECVDHAAMSGCFGGRLWATCTDFCRKVAVLDAVMYLYCKGHSRIHGREKVMHCIEVVFGGAGSNSSAGDGFPLNEGDGIASKEVVL